MRGIKTPEEVIRKIMKLHDAGVGVNETARQTGVSRQTVSYYRQKYSEYKETDPKDVKSHMPVNLLKDWDDTTQKILRRAGAI